MLKQIEDKKDKIKIKKCVVWMFELLLATETSENLQVVLLAKRGRVNPRSCTLSTAHSPGQLLTQLFVEMPH